MNVDSTRMAQGSHFDAAAPHAAAGHLAAVLADTVCVLFVEHAMGVTTTRHTSHVTRHTSHVTRHTSHVTRHTSHVTRHLPPPLSHATQSFSGSSAISRSGCLSTNEASSLRNCKRCHVTRVLLARTRGKQTLNLRGGGAIAETIGQGVKQARAVAWLPHDARAGDYHVAAVAAHVFRLTTNVPPSCKRRGSM